MDNLSVIVRYCRSFVEKSLKEFDLTYVKDNGFVLRFPTVYVNDKIKKYVHHDNMFKVFKEHRDWAKLINVQNTVDLNKIVSTGKISDLIKIDETLQSNRLLNVAKEINDKKNNPNDMAQIDL